mgnify:CR=1 FL=1
MSATGSAACCSRWHTRACAILPPGNLPVNLSQGQMAAMVCSTQPTVSETLHQLQDEGLIDIRGRGIVIRRPQALLAALESPADRA